MQVRLQAKAKAKVLPRIYSLPQEARTSEAPIYRSCSDTKAEQDKWHLLHTHESPKKAAAQKPAPASSYISAKAHTPDPVLERSSGKQTAKTVQMGNLQSRSVPDKGAGSEGKAGVPSKAHTVPDKGARDEGKTGVPSNAHTQHAALAYSSGKQASTVHMAQPRSIPEPANTCRGRAEQECSYAPMSDCTSGKQAGRAMHLATPQSRSVPDRATRMGGSPPEVCYHVPTKTHNQGSESGYSSGKQASRAVNMATSHSTSEGKATRCEGKAELMCDAMSDVAEAADWQMLGAQLAPATYSFYSTDVTAVVEDASLYVICTHPLCMHTLPASAVKGYHLAFSLSPLTCIMAVQMLRMLTCMLPPACIGHVLSGRCPHFSTQDSAQQPTRANLACISKCATDSHVISPSIVSE